jgi:Protein of unknown function (DUF4238)
VRELCALAFTVSKKSERPKPRGHHYIPRFLLNNFSSRNSGSEHHIWLFRADGVVECNTRDVAKQKDFHGHPDQSTLESDIADEEAKFAELLRAVLDRGIREEDYESIRELIVHLTVRTKNLREGFTQLGRQFWELTEEKLTATDKKTKLAHRRLLTKTLYKQLGEPPLRQVLSSMPPWRRKMFLNSLKTQVAKLDLSSEMKDLFSQFRESVQESTTGAATNAQLRVLGRELAPAKRVEQLAKFSWSLIHQQAADFVLGDVLVLGLCTTRSGFVHPITTDDDDPLEAVVLPITPSSAVLGSIKPRSMSVSEINIASVELSRELFVARRSGQMERDLACHLGARANLMSAEQLRNILD